MKDDLIPVFNQLKINPGYGKAIGNDCYKIRVGISSKSRGKSGGARIIAYIGYIKGTVYLIDIYDKSEQDNISEKEITELIALILE